MSQEELKNGGSDQRKTEKALDRKDIHQRAERAAIDIKVYHVGELENKVGIIEAFLREEEEGKAYEVLKEVEKELETLHEEKMRHPHEAGKEALRHIVGWEVVHLRRKRRMSRADLAQKVECLTEDDIAKIERGERAVDIDEFEEIAKALDATPEVGFIPHYEHVQ